MRIHDTILGLFFIAAATAMLAYTGTFPAFPGQKYGPSLFPRILGAGIILCGVIILLRGWRGATSGGDRRIIAFDSIFAERSRLISFLLVPLSILFYLVSAERLGFIPTAFVLLVGLFLWFRVKPITALIIGVAMTWLMQWFFGTMMRVPLPRGLYMQLLYGG